MCRRAFVRRQFNRIKECIPPKVRREMKRLLGKAVHKAVLIRDGEWVAMGAKKRIREVIRNTEKEYFGNIKRERQLPVDSRARDLFIEEQLHLGEYTWDSILLIQNPYGLAPLTALAVFTTKTACAVRSTVKGKLEKDDVTGTIQELTREHRVPILGLYPGEESQVVVELLDAGRNVTDKKELT